MKFSHLIYRTPLIYLWYCIRMCVVWKGATAPCPGSHVRCLERSDRSVPGCRRRGGRTLAHAHPEPRHLFFCQAPAQPRACGGGCAGRCTLLFMAWFLMGYVV